MTPGERLDPADELARVTRQIRDLERRQTVCVLQLRQRRVSWQRIGDLMGVSAARARAVLAR